MGSGEGRCHAAADAGEQPESPSQIAKHGSKPLKIGFLTQPGHTVLPPAGSLEIWTHEVARRLARRGHEVSIYASRVRDVQAQDVNGVHYRFVDHSVDGRIGRGMRPLFRALPNNRAFFSSRLHPLAYWARAARHIAADECEIVHVYNYSQALPFVRRANPDALLALHMQCEWLSQLARGMIGRRLARADLVLGCSDYISEKIRARFPEYGDRVGTLYNGVTVNGNVPLRRHGSNEIRLLHVGRISPEKGHHLLVSAFNELVEEHPNLTLTIVGEESLVPLDMALDLFGEADVEALRPFYSGSYLDRLQASLTPDARDRVRFVGSVPYEEAGAFYRDADIFVFPSIFEAFPIPPIEAMAEGLPVVASAVGGTVESVRHDETGLLVRRGDQEGLTNALRRLIEDQSLRAALGAAGRRRAQTHFSWESVCDAFEEHVARSSASRA